MGTGIEALAARFPQCVYIVRAVESGLVKVGTTKRLPWRLLQLASTHRSALEVLAVLPGTSAHERNIHFKLRDHLVPNKGREWFYDRPEVHAVYAGLPADQRPLGLFQPRSRFPLHPHNGLSDRERQAIRDARWRDGTIDKRCSCAHCQRTYAARSTPSLGAL